MTLKYQVQKYRNKKKKIGKKNEEKKVGQVDLIFNIKALTWMVTEQSLQQEIIYMLPHLGTE